MSDWGAKVSQKGVPVRTGADYQMVFSSSWPLLKIEAQGSFTLADASLDQDIYTHNLGYFPIFIVLRNDSSFYWSSGQARISEFEAPSVTTTKLKWMGARFGEPAVAVNGYYYVYRYDMTTSFTGNNLTTTTATRKTAGDFGIKVTKATKNTNSANLQDYTMNSRARSPQIFKTGTVTGVTNTITHNLGYVPLYFVFVKYTDTGIDHYRSATNSQDMTNSATTTDITFGSGSSLTYSYIILKDPFADD